MDRDPFISHGEQTPGHKHTLTELARGQPGRVFTVKRAIVAVRGGGQPWARKIYPLMQSRRTVRFGSPLADSGRLGLSPKLAGSTFSSR